MYSITEPILDFSINTFLYRHIVWVTIDEVSIGEWIYWQLTSHNYKQQ
jgi:hypothetical protein